ncbi:MAG TPA: hypothetical protein VIK25_02400 [Gemmatimonadaceae bacterium]
MRRLLLWCVLGGAACASSTKAPETGASTSRTVQVAGMPGKLTVTSQSRASVTGMAFTVDQVWKVLPSVLDSLGVKASSIDPSQHAIGAENFKVRVQLGRTPLSRYLECGGTQVGANADSYEVLLTVLAQVQPVATGGSTLSTLFEAVAKPIAFSQGYSKCSSKGLFETRLVEAVKKRLQG